MMNLSQFIGTKNYFFNPLYPELNYTDGVQYLINAGKCEWFLDIVATDIYPLSRIHSFITIELILKDSEGFIGCSDGNENQIFQKNIPSTDCEDGFYILYLQNQILMLASEY